MASVCTRFGVFAAGVQSAADPRAVIEPQRAALAAAAADAMPATAADAPPAVEPMRGEVERGGTARALRRRGRDDPRAGRVRRWARD